jgi:hypothetical protein
LKAIDLFNSAGTVASLIGLLIVIFQITKLKKIAEASREASEKTRNRITELLFAMDIPKALKIVQEIQSYNRSYKLEQSIMRMQDLKYHLTQIKNNEKYSSAIDKKLYLGFILDLSVDISNMEKELFTKSKSLNITKINDTLESVFNYLTDIDTTVKTVEGISYDS